MLKENKAQIIKDRITMADVIDKYGFETNKSHFICCPFHSEDTPSMKVYDNDYHCFGCGEHGDILDFVQKIFNLSFTDTLKKIDSDFNLNLYGNRSFEELRQAHYKTQAMQLERANKKREKEKKNELYWALFDEWLRLDNNIKEYAPKDEYEELHPLFVEAVHRLSYQGYLIDCFDWKGGVTK